MASTHLKYMVSDDLDALTNAVEALPFRVEIKGAPVSKDDDWYLFFTIDEKDPKAKRFQPGRIEG